MNTQRLLKTAMLFVALLTSVAPTRTANAQGTAFTYQGRLNSGGNPADGFFDITFSLWSAAGGGTQQGSTLTRTALAVSNGLFTVTLDFGSQFPGADRWLEIGVRTNGGGGFTTLSPRQKLAASPYAITSGNLTGSLPAGQVTGTMGVASLPTGGNWALLSTLTLDTSTLAIDPVNKRVGIGTASPLWPFHQVAAQGVVRLDSTASPFGSVLELRNGTASPSYLGAINFNNAASTYPGQIGYYANDVLAFRVAGGQRMELLGNGQLSVFGSSTRGIYAESAAAGGIGMYGFAGPAGTASGGNGNTGVFGESAQNNGNGVVGMANSGPSAFGVWGKSTSGSGGVFDGGTYGIRALSSGTAAHFNNLTVVESDSSLVKPQLRLHETQDGDYARLEFQAASRPYWHIAVGGGAANQMNFYNSTNGDVMTLAQNGTLFVKVLTITGGADIAEPFQVSEPGPSEGSVVIIDEDNPGKLRLSTQAYDSRVAGVISGAGGVQPGLSLQQNGVVEGNRPVALTGRVYVQADATQEAIKPGDLLTTSDTPGCAMKVTDRTRAQGAVLGKAMTGLKAGRGLVLVLVSLQ